MSSDVAGLRTFSVDTENETELVTKDGQKVSVVAESTVSVERPNKLRTDREGALADISFFYDGKTVTVWGRKANLYATTPAPATIDQMIDFTRQKLGIEAPAADLLSADPYSALMGDVVSGRYIADEPIRGKLCHHLAYRGHDTDWQIWIEDGPQALPCRFEIVSKTVPGQPEYVVSLENWQVNPSLPASTFSFTPPPGSERIAFLELGQRARQTKGEMKR